MTWKTHAVPHIPQPLVALINALTEYYGFRVEALSGRKKPIFLRTPFSDPRCLRPIIIFKCILPDGRLAGGLGRKHSGAPVLGHQRYLLPPRLVR